MSPVRLAAISIACATWFVGVGGCAKIFPRPAVDYRTVETNPNQDPELARKKNEQALAALAKNDCDTAQRLLQESLVADVTFGPAHNNLGQLYFRPGKYYLAAWEFEYATRLMPDRAEPLNNLGLVYETVGKVDEAIVSYESAHGQSPENFEFLGNLVRAKWRQGERDEETIALMRELLYRDQRSAWRGWAQEALVFHESRGVPVQPVFGPPLEQLPPPTAPGPEPAAPTPPETDGPRMLPAEEFLPMSQSPAVESNGDKSATRRPESDVRFAR
jgi:tetratricopeptide (TPR) repeat protein